MINGEARVFAGPASQKLGQRICKHINVPLGNVQMIRFKNNGETYCHYRENIRSKDVYIVQSIEAPANERLMELLIMIDAAKRASPQRIPAVIPFFGYARHDKKARSRVSITARLVADMIEKAGAHRVMTLDLHAAQIQGFFSIPVDHLFASQVILRGSNPRSDVSKNNALHIVSPDFGGIYRANIYAQEFDATIVFIPRNKSEENRSEHVKFIGEIKPSSKVIIVDDIIETGKTMKNAAEILRDNGAQEVRAVISHFNMQVEARDELVGSGLLGQIYTTDSTTRGMRAAIDHKLKITVSSVAPLFGEAIIRSNSGHTISTLFREGGDEDVPEPTDTLDLFAENDIVSGDDGDHHAAISARTGLEEWLNK